MEYTPPIGGTGSDPYIDLDLVHGVDGSDVPAAAIEAPQREIVNVITMSGLAASGADNTQLYQAIVRLIGVGGHAVVVDSAVFEGTVTNGKAVRWDNSASNFTKAIADGTAHDEAVGIADVSNSRVYCFGPTPAGLVTGMTPGARQYLSGASAGALVETVPSDGISMGIAKTATILFVDIDAITAVTDATEVAKGIAEIATQTETNTGTDDARMVTPLKLDTTIKNVSRTYAKPQRAARSTPAYASSFTPDFDAAQDIIIGALTGNITVNNPTTGSAGQAGLMKFVQDATGGRIPAFGSYYDFGQDGMPDFNTSPNGVTWVQYYLDALATNGIRLVVLT